MHMLLYLCLVSLNCFYHGQEEDRLTRQNLDWDTKKKQQWCSGSVHPKTRWRYVINWTWGGVAKIRENAVASFPLQVEASKSGLATTPFMGSWPWSWCFSNLVNWWSRGRNYSYFRQSRANSCQDSNNKRSLESRADAGSPYPSPFRAGLTLQGVFDTFRLPRFPLPFCPDNGKEYN